MITLPPEYTATKYPGYFWNTKIHQLYSLKIDGILKPLKLSKPNRYNNLWEPAYRVSVQGQRRLLTERDLKKLEVVDSQIPVK